VVADQLALIPDAGVPAHVRLSWLALPYRDHRQCVGCGSACMTAGRRRSAQRCLDCHAAARKRPRQRRTTGALLTE
jgi:predicted nucleic acid-binding Zn ribbon protein